MVRLKNWKTADGCNFFKRKSSENVECFPYFWSLYKHSWYVPTVGYGIKKGNKVSKLGTILTPKAMGCLRLVYHGGGGFHPP